MSEPSRLPTPEVRRKVGVAPHTVNYIRVKFLIFVRQYSVTKLKPKQLVMLCSTSAMLHGVGISQLEFGRSFLSTKTESKVGKG